MKAHPRLSLADSPRRAVRGAAGAPCCLAGSCHQAGGARDCLSGACCPVSEGGGRLPGHCKPSGTSACRQHVDGLQSLPCAAALPSLSAKVVDVLQAAGTDVPALQCATGGLCTTLCNLSSKSIAALLMQSLFWACCGIRHQLTQRTASPLTEHASTLQMLSGAPVCPGLAGHSAPRCAQSRPHAESMQAAALCGPACGAIAGLSPGIRTCAA